jgi:hypothetical protein
VIKEKIKGGKRKNREINQKQEKRNKKIPLKTMKKNKIDPLHWRVGATLFTPLQGSFDP